MATEIIFRIVFTVFASVILTAAGVKMFQIYQLSSYKARGFFGWFKSTKCAYLIRYAAAAAAPLVFMLIFLLIFSKFTWGYYAASGFFFMFGILFIFLNPRFDGIQKTPLKLTGRIWRLIFTTLALFAAAVYPALMLGSVLPVPGYSVTALFFFLIPLVVTLAHYIILPVELLIQRHYKNLAKERLNKNEGLIRIGITGSFGKTTAKNILERMLQKKYRVFATPASYNTPMGISKAVNNAPDAVSDAQVFIAEMGARHKGDIKTLCDLVGPSAGLITGIGNQHLEHFGSTDNIMSGKYELIENLRGEKKAYFNIDNDLALKLSGRYNGDKRLTGAQADSGGYDLAVSYSDYAVSDKGVSFNLRCGEKLAAVNTKLLGRHIPSLAALCTAAALDYGVSFEDAAMALDDMTPLPHRLELLKGGDGTIIIDDAYNSNPAGAVNALEVLGCFKDMVKVIITPGLVELGQEEKEENKNLGKNIAAVADYAILNSSLGAYIKQGCLEAGMDEGRIILTTSLSEATEKLKSIDGAKAVLFENDLPDNVA
jgi:UDP-N-acetylmuramoyl-tripeptide--D-alanyl-D-alanine ligase